MRIKSKSLAAWWMLTLLAVASASAANDLRLVEATQKGDTEAVRSLLKQHVNVNAAQADGATALAWAAYRDDIETVGLLIGAGAAPNAANDYGVTPLSLACTNASAPMVDKLLKAGANPNAATWTGETVLMQCARTGSLDSVKSLLARGAAVNARESRQKHTSLMWAVANKHSDVARMLIEHGAEIHARSKGGFTPLLFASQQGDLESARMLLAAGADVNETTPDGDAPLLVASLSGHEAFSIFLLEKGANPDAADHNGLTALFNALLGGTIDITGVVNRSYLVPYLHRRPNMVELVKALLAHRANPNARLVSPAKSPDGDDSKGYGKIMRTVMVNAGRVSPIGATPLMAAAATYDAEVMRMLVAAGADPQAKTKENVTVLMMAAGMFRERKIARHTEEQERNSLEAVKLAVELGGDVNAVNNLEMTALFAAVYCGSNSVVQYLVEQGANVNAKDRTGQTPLEKALNIVPANLGPGEQNLRPYNRYDDTAELLLKLGATPTKAAKAAAAHAADAGAAAVGE